jgi:hypothetical protein
MINIYKVTLFAVFVLLTSVVLSNLLIGLEGKCAFWPYIDTKFARNFSVNKFKGISQGMAYSEVKSILGEPLVFSDERISSVMPENTFFTSAYASDGKCKWSDFAWKSFDIYFDQDTNVIGKHSQWWYD